MNRLIETLKNEQVTKFVADVASELGKYGLDKPQLQLTLSSFASENTAETKSGEQPFATIAFGKTEGDDVYAHLGDEPFIVAVKRDLLDKIFVDPLQWQGVVIFQFKPEQVHRLSVVTDREQSITRGPKNEWKWVRGSGPINRSKRAIASQYSDFIACGSLGRSNSGSARIRKTADGYYIHDIAG